MPHWINWMLVLFIVWSALSWVVCIGLGRFIRAGMTDLMQQKEVEQDRGPA